MSKNRHFLILSSSAALLIVLPGTLFKIQDRPDALPVKQYDFCAQDGLKLPRLSLERIVARSQKSVFFSAIGSVVYIHLYLHLLGTVS